MNRLRRQDRSAGLTLVELLTTMALTSILLATCATLFLGATRSTTSTGNRLEEINDGRVAVSAIGRSLRTAILPSQLFDITSTEAAFISASPYSLRFYANVDNANNAVGPTKVVFDSVGGVLTETKQLPLDFDAESPKYVYCTPGPGCVTKTKVLARGVTRTSPIFRYYDSLGNELTGTTLSTAQLEIVDSVDIVVTVQKASVAGNGSTFALRVALPNHDAAQRSDDEETP